jgi:TatD family-associated radical SAM protein
LDNVYAYEYKGNLYINLTNQCTNSCDFCIRNKGAGVGGEDLWLEKEPLTSDVIAQMERHAEYREVVFCGYGEPTLKLDVLLEVAAYAKRMGKRVRINTNGQGQLYHHRAVPPLLAGLVDTVSISLNAPDAKTYNELCHSIYGEKAFEGLLKFAAECKEYVPEVVLSIVDLLSDADKEKCKAVADSIGVKLRIREYN